MSQGSSETGAQRKDDGSSPTSSSPQAPGQELLIVVPKELHGSKTSLPEPRFEDQYDEIFQKYIKETFGNGYVHVSAASVSEAIVSCFSKRLLPASRLLAEICDAYFVLPNNVLLSVESPMLGWFVHLLGREAMCFRVTGMSKKNWSDRYQHGMGINPLAMVTFMVETPSNPRFYVYSNRAYMSPATAEQIEGLIQRVGQYQTAITKQPFPSIFDWNERNTAPVDTMIVDGKPVDVFNSRPILSFEALEKAFVWHQKNGETARCIPAKVIYSGDETTSCCIGSIGRTMKPSSKGRKETERQERRPVGHSADTPGCLDGLI